MAELRGGLIGCGFFSINHLHGWRDVEGASIIALCDRDPARLALAGDQFGIARRYADAAQMLVRLTGVAPAISAHVPIILSTNATEHTMFLITSDPDKFKTVTADIAQKLKDAAGSKTGKQADFLNQLADKFSAASQSGSASDLPAPRAHGHHGGHHHHAQAANGASSSTGQSGSATGGPGDLFQSIDSIISGALEGTST